jgi:hypothetical protein
MKGIGKFLHNPPEGAVFKRYGAELKAFFERK